MAAEASLIAVPEGVLAALRAALAEAALDPSAAPELLGLCEAVLLRLQFPSVAAAEPAERTAPAGIAADPSRVAQKMQAEATRLEAHEARVAAAGRLPSAPSLRITEEGLTRYLGRRFAGQVMRVAGVRELRGGRSKLTVMLQLSESGRLPRELVLRLDRPGSAQSTNVAEEFTVLRAMHQAGACAPEPLWLEPDATGLGAPFLAMRRMPGETLGDYWSAGRATAAHAASLAQALAGIHAVPVASVWAGGASSASDCVREQLSRCARSWRAASARSSVAIESALAWLEERTGALRGPSVPVHGDVHFGNAMFAAAEISCLTDWEFAHPGHPAEDLAFCRSYVESVMPWPQFLAHYQAAGGRQTHEEELRYFRIWTYLRNSVLSAVALRRLLNGEALDIRTAAIALHSGARLESALARALATELEADSR